EDDEKYYLFGGAPTGSPGAASGQLYVLDLKSQSFTKLGTETEKRAFMACAATRHSFIAWGGTGVTGQLANTVPLIFNFAIGNWVNFNSIPPPPPPPPPPPVIPPEPGNPGNKSENGTNPRPGGNNHGNGTGTGTGENGKGNNNSNGTGNGSNDGLGSGSSQSNIAAIAGGTGGGIVLITLVALFVYFRRERRKSSKYDEREDPSKRSSPRDDYSGSGRQDSWASDNEKEYNNSRPESPPAIRKKRSTTLRRESDRDHEYREKTDPLQHNPNFDHDLGSSKTGEQPSSSRHTGSETPALTRTNTSASSGWNQEWDQENPQPRYSPENDLPAEKTSRLATDNQRGHMLPRPPIAQLHPDRQQRNSPPQPNDQQKAILEARAPQYVSPSFNGYRHQGNIQLNDPQYNTRPREPQYGTPSHDDPRYGGPQYGIPHPFGFYRGDSEPGESQYGTA
ncbi:hypothetical protein BGW38_006764, partial [Lunasporangiospora selenospora]